MVNDQALEMSENIKLNQINTIGVHITTSESRIAK